MIVSMNAPPLLDKTVSLKAVQAVLNQIAQPMFVWHRNTYSILGFNQAASDLYRYAPRDLMSRSILELRPSSEIEQTIQRTKDLTAPTDVGTFIHRTKDGVNFPVRIYGGPIAPGAMVALVADLRGSVSEAQRPEASDLGPGPDLSPREEEVIAHLALGLTSQEIAQSLGITRRTVEAHVDHILAKLGARNRAHAIALALGNGLLLGNRRN